MDAKEHPILYKIVLYPAYAAAILFLYFFSEEIALTDPPYTMAGLAIASLLLSVFGFVKFKEPWFAGPLMMVLLLAPFRHSRGFSFVFAFLLAGGP